MLSKGNYAWAEVRASRLLVIVAFTALVGMLLFPSVASAQTLFVDDDAPAGGNGTSWSTACRHLQDALAAALSNTTVTEIRVAAGTYTPDMDEAGTITPADQTASFTPRSGLILRGGYRGLSVGGDPNERSVGTFLSVLSGDLNGDDGTVGRTDNSCHVVSFGGVDATAVLEGFVISGGNAVGCSNSNGGGVFNEGGSPTIINCTFNGNTADMGGGLANELFVSPVLVNCAFSGNGAQYGGALYNALLTSPSLTNCTVSGNRASLGGGVYNVNNSATLANCILWGNVDDTGSGEFAQIYDDLGVSQVTFSCIQDDDPNDGNIPFGGAVNGNIDDNPLFVRDPNPGPDGNWDGVQDDFGDLYLQDAAPCIDAGDDTSVPADGTDLDGDGDTVERIPFDLRGKRRFVDHPSTADTGIADPPTYTAVVDMGALEHQTPPKPGDIDGDGDVDLDDYAAWEACMTGPDTTPPDGCQGKSLDGDSDVDLADYAMFQTMFNESTVPPTPVGDPADMDRDGDVDLPDYAILTANFPA